MAELVTNFGVLQGVDIRSYYSNKKQDGALALESNEIQTPYGALVPQYEAEDMGRRQVKPIYYYKSGEIKSLPLQTQTSLKTSIGEIPAELVTFYQSGAIKRIFPLDGKLSGYWTWEEEQKLAEPVALQTPIGIIEAKFIGIQFYESGAIKSFTLWPKEIITVQTPAGEMNVRTGMSFYESGAVRSFEPAEPVSIETPIGDMLAYDSNPLGIHGDINSVQFTEEGKICALNTIDNEIKIIDKQNNRYLYKPLLKDALCGHKKKEPVPLRIQFTGSEIMFHGSENHKFSLSQCQFELTQKALPVEPITESCSV